MVGVGAKYVRARGELRRAECQRRVEHGHFAIGLLGHGMVGCLSRHAKKGKPKGQERLFNE
jgi:hypothetical protein